MVRLYDIIEQPQNVFVDENPFSFIKVENDYTYWNSNEALRLDDGGLLTNPAARFYAIVKANWTVRMRFSTNVNGYFDPLKGSNYDQWRKAYNADIYGSFLFPANLGLDDEDSILEVDMRGGSAVMIALTGDKGSYDKEGSPFDLYMINAYGADETHSSLNGFALSLTSPFRNYDTSRVNLTLLKPVDRRIGDENMRVQIIDAYKTDPFSNTSGDFDITPDIPQEFKDRQGVFVIDSETGFDNNLAEWTVAFMQENRGETLYHVVVDGTVQETFTDFNAGQNAYFSAIDERRRKGETVRNFDTDWVKWALLGFGGLALAIFLFRRIK